MFFPFVAVFTLDFLIPFALTRVYLRGSRSRLGRITFSHRLLMHATGVRLSFGPSTTVMPMVTAWRRKFGNGPESFVIIIEVNYVRSRGCVSCGPYYKGPESAAVFFCFVFFLFVRAHENYILPPERDDTLVPLYSEAVVRHGQREEHSLATCHASKKWLHFPCPAQIKTPTTTFPLQFQFHIAKFLKGKSTGNYFFLRTVALGGGSGVIHMKLYFLVCLSWRSGSRRNNKFEHEAVPLDCTRHVVCPCRRAPTPERE